MDSRAELVAALLRGDDRAFATLVAWYKDVVYGLALSFLKDFDAAHDAAQEVFLRAFLKLHQLDDPEKLPAWLRSITAHVCATWLGRQRPQVGIEGLECGGMETSYPCLPERPDEQLEREEERSMVMRALARLPEESRQILTLYYLGEQPSAAIAGFLGISPAAVRQRLHRARRQLKEEVLTMVGDVLRNAAPGGEFEEELRRLLDRVKDLFSRAAHQEAIPLLEAAHQQAPEDTLVALLLADAYVWGRTPDEVGAAPPPCERACALLEGLIAREPDNLLARIKLAELRSVGGGFAEVLAENEENLRRARGGPFEPLALLRLARVYAPRRHQEKAVECYQELIEKDPRYTGVACQEMAVSHYLSGDFSAGIACLERGVAFLRDSSQEDLSSATRQLMGERYAAFWDGADPRLVQLFHAHLWLAGLCAKNQETERARQCLRAAVDCLDWEEVAPARSVLVRDLLRQVETGFAELAGEACIQGLREER